MPRNGQGQYSKPPNTTAQPNTTIKSAVFNAVVDDLVVDANTARPITAGGTGGVTVEAARSGLELDKKVVYAEKSANYTAVDADNNAIHRFTAAATLTIDPAANLGANWHYTSISSGGLLTIDPNGSEKINGASSLILNPGDTALILRTGIAGSEFFAIVQTSAVDPWAFCPVGAYVALDDGVVGIVAPPKDRAYRYVELTAGLTGSGAYNESILTSETVGGSSPLITATAVVSLTGSPLDGKTIRLINTERRVLRAGSAGTLQDDAMQTFTSTFELRKLGGGESIFGGTSGGFSLNVGGGSGASRVNIGLGGSLSTDALNFVLANASVRTDTETRARNIGVKYYRRIK